MRFLLLTSLLLMGLSAAAAEPPPLRNNPFTRPPTLFVDIDSAVTEDLGGAPLLLVATMVSSQRAIANVEGQVLRPGDEIRGYQLKRILEDRAIFERNGNEVVVFVKPQLEEEDDRPTRRNGRR